MVGTNCTYILLLKTAVVRNEPHQVVCSSNFGIWIMGVISITTWENLTCTENFRGLKYKSDNYQLCQACFWCGHIDSEHKNDVFKEYNSHKTSGKYVNNMMTAT